VVSVQGNVLRIIVDPDSTLGVDMHISQPEAEGGIKVYNEGRALAVGSPECTLENTEPSVLCSGVEAYEISTASGDDEVSISLPDVSGTASLGPGKDHFVFGEADGEVVDGGSGVDTAMYFHGETDVSVSLDNVANDGAAGEADNVMNFEDIETGDGDDILIGNAAPNVLVSRWGADVMHGLGGVDTVRYAGNYLPRGEDGVTVTLDNVANDGVSGENDNIKPDIENLEGTYAEEGDVLIGDSGDNRLVGHNANDILMGGAGNDVLVPGGAPTGGTTVFGGPGTDTVDYSPATVDFKGLGEIPCGCKGANVSLDNVANDGVSHAGEPATDNVKPDVEDIVGTIGDDVLVGSAGHNVLAGGAGKDRLAGGGGDDRLIGGLEADHLHGGSGTDVAVYSERVASGVYVNLDNLANDGGSPDGPAGARDNVLTTVENVLGGGAGDYLVGSSAANVLSGGKGGDKLYGMGGNDLLYGGAAADFIDGGPGVDTVTYADRKTSAVYVHLDNVSNDGDGSDGPSGKRDNVRTTVENVIGGDKNDFLVGSALANRLTGGKGADKLYGMGGKDTLIAKDAFKDAVINGGTGQDTATRDSIDPLPVSVP
jgi:Ca2+-binding RTX toxin-like protein